MTTLVRTGSPGDPDLAGLQSRAAELEGQLAARDGEVARVRAALAAFKVKYRQEVGLLHEQLDELERAIAEAELGEQARRAEGTSRDDADADAAADGAEARTRHAVPLPRYTSDGVRKLFRDVAKAIHPDLARDDQARDRRHTLMIEANKAYAVGDEERLRSILQAWENSPEAVLGDDQESVRVRLERRIAQIEAQLEVLGVDLAALEDTPLWKLKTLVDEAAARRKDLVGDMVKRLKRDIMVAQNRLDAIRSIP